MKVVKIVTIILIIFRKKINLLPKRIFFIITALVISITSYSKTFSYKHFSVEDGLPSSEVYDCVQDDEGFMWFATERGVARFDGYEFDVFTKKDGLLENKILLVYKDYKNRIWFSSISGLLCYYENGKIHPYPYNHIIKKNVNDPCRSIVIEKSNKVHLGTYNNGYYSIDHKGKIIMESSDIQGYGILNLNGEKIIYSTQNGSTRNMDNLFYKSWAGINYQLESNTNNFQLPHIPNISTDIVNETDVLYYAIGNSLYKYEDNKESLIFEAKSTIFQIKITKGKIWIGTLEKGFWILNSLSNEPILSNELSPITIFNFYLDNEGSMWILTTNGIFLLVNQSNHTITTKDGLTSNISLALQMR